MAWTKYSTYYVCISSWTKTSTCYKQSEVTTRVPCSVVGPLTLPLNHIQCQAIYQCKGKRSLLLTEISKPLFYNVVGARFNELCLHDRCRFVTDMSGVCVEMSLHQVAASHVWVRHGGVCTSTFSHFIHSVRFLPVMEME